MVRKEDNFFSSFMSDFAEKGSSGLLIKEVNPKQRDIDKPFPLCIQCVGKKGNDEKIFYLLEA